MDLSDLTLQKIIYGQHMFFFHAWKKHMAVRAVLSESRQAHFSIRLWDSRDLLEAIYRSYERLPAEMRRELPLKQVWMRVSEVPEV